MRKYFTRTLGILGFCILTLFSGCDEGDGGINFSSGDFYPMKEDASWQYISEWGCDYIECNEKFPNWFQYVLEDTIIQNKKYTVIRGVYDVAKIARREGNKYYEWHIYDEEEYLFLDAGLSPGESWIKQQDQYWKTEVFVEEPMTTLRVKDKQFSDVIVMREERSYDDGSYSYLQVTHHYYAKDIGEVLSVSPAVPNTYFGGSKFSLFKYER